MPKMKAIPIERLGSEIAKIVKEYKEEAVDDTKTLVRRTANKGLQALKGTSSAVITGRYARGWHVKVFEERLNTTAVIYHQTGLPHLLENGHATTNGGRVAGRPHIKPVEEELVQDFVREMEKTL